MQGLINSSSCDAFECTHLNNYTFCQETKHFGCQVLTFLFPSLQQMIALADTRGGVKNLHMHVCTCAHRHTSTRDSCLTDSRLLSFVKFSVAFCSSVVIFANLLIKSALSFSASDTDTTRSCKQTSRLILQSFVTKHDEPSFNCTQSEVSFSYFTKVVSHKSCLLCVRTANWKTGNNLSLHCKTALWWLWK